jgi:hypothetical protein
MDSGREFNMFNYQWHPYQVGHVIWLAYSRIRVLGLTKMNLWNNKWRLAGGDMHGILSW